MGARGGMVEWVDRNVRNGGHRSNCPIEVSRGALIVGEKSHRGGITLTV